MRCPRLSDLPPPPPGKTGWPWTVESPQLPDVMPGGKPWPRISIVTPSYNQGQFIEETIRSVLLQGYPDVEYIIIDGGSSDDSAKIIARYERWLCYWVSERDRGQAHAINKGLSRTSGLIHAYLNSDDIYLSGAFREVSSSLVSGGFDVFVGQSECIGCERPPFLPWRRSSWRQQWHLRIAPFTYPLVPELTGYYRALPQHSVFWIPKQDRLLQFDETLDFVLDYEFFLRLLSGAHVVHSQVPVAAMRVHENAKSSTIVDVRDREARRYRHVVAKIAASNRARFAALRKRYTIRSILAILTKTFSGLCIQLGVVYPDYFDFGDWEETRRSVGGIDAQQSSPRDAVGGSRVNDMGQA